jgi:hypothetical protein
LCAAFCTEATIETVKVPNFMSLGLRYPLVPFRLASRSERWRRRRKLVNCKAQGNREKRSSQYASRAMP